MKRVVMTVLIGLGLLCAVQGMNISSKGEIQGVGFNPTKVAADSDDMFVFEQILKGQRP